MREKKAKDILLLLILAATAVLPHGYHLGHQDGAIYLPAIKKSLDPALYPHDSVFFLAQTRWTLFPEMVAHSVHITRLPLDWGIFLWHLLSIFLVLLACRELARRCFATRSAQWAAVVTVWAARLMPATGTQLSVMDRYLHPRDLATAALLFAFVALLDRRPSMLAWIAVAAVMHPTMAAFGAFHLAVQRFGLGNMPRRALALLVPLAVFWPAPNEAWREVLSTRPYLFPLRWHWYEWVGVAVPLVMLGWYAWVAKRSSAHLVEHISRRVVLAGIIGIAGSIVITTVPLLEPLIPTEPMRTLHFVYFLFVFLGGGLLGEHWLQHRPGRWLLFFAPLCLVFFLSNTLVYRSSPHIEWPGRLPKNAWVEAFDWIRRNTPRGALFALDPLYMRRPGEDSHGFRSFAERSMLADWVKDRAVSALEPDLAPVWRQQVRDRERWREFGAEDFRRLKEKYGVSWVVLERSQTSPARTGKLGGLSCPYANTVVSVCRIE